MQPEEDNVVAFLTHASISVGLAMMLCRTTFKRSVNVGNHIYFCVDLAFVIAAQPPIGDQARGRYSNRVRNCGVTDEQYPNRLTHCQLPTSLGLAAE